MRLCSQASAHQPRNRSAAHAHLPLRSSSTPPSPFAQQVRASHRLHRMRSRGYGPSSDITLDYAHTSCVVARHAASCRMKSRARVISVISNDGRTSVCFKGAPLPAAPASSSCTLRVCAASMPCAHAQRGTHRERVRLARLHPLCVFRYAQAGPASASSLRSLPFVCAKFRAGSHRNFGHTSAARCKA